MNTEVVLLAIPVRPGPRNEQLRHALRAWHATGAPVDPVVIGGRPAWYTGHHLPTVQVTGGNAQWRVNFPRAMHALLGSGLVDDAPLLWAADDIYPLAAASIPPHPLHLWPTWCRKSDLADYVARWQARHPAGYTRHFVDGMAGQLAVLRAVGVTATHNADTHMPHVLRADRLAELLDLLEQDFPAHPAGHFRAIYGAMWPGSVVRQADPKVDGRDRPPRTGLGWCSTSPVSWPGTAGQHLRAAFTTPSPWERP